MIITNGTTLGPGVTVRAEYAPPLPSYLPSTLFELDASAYTSGPTLIDQTGNGHNGTLNGSTTWNSDAGGCFVFTGNYSDYIEVQGSEQGWGMAGNPANATFSVWANIPGASSFQHIAGWRGGFQFWFLLLNGSSTTEARFDNGTNWDINIDYAPHFGSWTQTTFVVNAAQNYTRLYFNGVEANTVTGVSGNFSTGVDPFTLGCDLNNGFAMTGKIGGSTAYNASLTDAEVLAEFNRTKARYGL